MKNIMAWKPRPISPLSEHTYAHDSGKTSYQSKEDFQSPQLFSLFFKFLLLVLAFSALVLVGIYIKDGKDGPMTRPKVFLQFDSFSVIDFKVMESQLVANWTARFIFINNKNNSEISIEPFELLAFYERTNLVSCASMAEPLVLRTKYQSVIEVEFSPKSCNKLKLPMINGEVLEEMGEDLNKGKISLSLNLEANCKGRIWGHCGVKLEQSCGLDLQFNSTKQSAKDCRIPLPACLIHH
ncbi:hypothetical protein CCACVL1_00007 [Corchorus capsularis]|uniref:Late embryogenesis abundant protein, LEA-14 n=1 Tax=Corchorus capsularis TaxID=210143 RepID=A0A1R3KZC9_COCAP|nr:hypothetical protein CCACVL1_00007 [Corchorus capsularis]